MKKHYYFTSVITQEDKYYIARCIELGVVSQGLSIEDATRNLREAVELYLEDSPVGTLPESMRQPAFVTSMEFEYA